MSSFVYSKEIENVGKYDVVVLGGGMAGVSAAIEAAENGASVLLVEATGMLGGMATSGLVGPFMSVYDPKGEELLVGGIYRRIVERLEKYSAVIPPEKTDAPSIHTSFIEKYHKRVTPFNSFALQIVLDEMVKEAGVDLLLYTRFADCIMENGKIKSVVLLALEGLVSVSGEVFIDCTGNADLVAAAGFGVYKGEEKSGIPQPATLMFEVSNVDDKDYSARGSRPEYPVKAYRMPQENIYKVNHYRVFDVDATNSQSMTNAHIKARKQVIDAYNVLKNKTEGFENAEIVQVASVLGVRESRHIVGEYKITVSDVSNGTKFEDSIAVYGYGMDVHPRNANENGNFKIATASKYYIPYRSLLPKNSLNLLVAGKTISCESQAAGGLRCMPSCMAMGQAAGLAAAIATQNNLTVNKIDIKQLKNELVKKGAIVD